MEHGGPCPEHYRSGPPLLRAGPSHGAGAGDRPTERARHRAVRWRHAEPRRALHRTRRQRRHSLARPARGPQRHGTGVLGRPAARHGRALGTDRAVRAIVIAAEGPHFSVGLDLKAMAGMLTGGRRGHRAGPGESTAATGPPRWRHGPSRRDQASFACRPRSRRWPSARSRSSPPSTATASAAASTSSRRATSAWRVPTPSSRCARPRWPSWPTSGACSGCPASSARGTWPSWPSPARTSPRRGPRRSAS